MNITLIIKIKYIILIVGFLILFIFSQISIEGRKGQEYFSFFEALTIASPFLIMQLYLFSNYNYDLSVEYGYKINYNMFQFLGLLVAIIVTTITTLASFGCSLTN